MSKEKTKERNKSKSFTLNKCQKNNNSKTSRQQIIKKNKIINIRIYQNYSNNKNSNTIFNPCSNNIINNINIPLEVTYEIGTQTITDKNSKNKIKNDISVKSNNIIQRNTSNAKNNKELQKYENHYNFSKTFSATLKNKKILKNENKIVRKKKVKNITKNISYNINVKRKQIINLKENMYNKNKLFEVNEDLNNSIKNIINKNNKKNESNNRSDEKNKVAKKFALFNLKNDNKYLIINDGNYDSHYHENSKLSINNIFIRHEKKNTLDKNKLIMKRPNTPKELKFEQHLHNERNICNIYEFHSNNNQNKDKEIHSNNCIKDKKDNNYVNKDIYNNIKQKYINVKNKFENLTITKNNNIFINNEKNSDINEKQKKIEINDKQNFYSKFITNINNNVNKFFLNYENKQNYEQKNIIKEENNNINILKEQKEIINDITKNSFKILSKNSKIEENKEKNKVEDEKNKKLNKQPKENQPKKNENNLVLKAETNKEKSMNKENSKKKNSKLKDNKNMNMNKKLESFFNDVTQEDENGVKFEDLLKTYTDESIKGNQSIEEMNNKIIGDEKTFFNNSKIPKIEECNHKEEYMKENDKNINNINIKANKRNRNNFFINDLEGIKTSKVDSTEEKDIFKLLRKKFKKKKEDDEFEKIIKSNNYINAKNYIFNIDKNYQRNLHKEKMYNFLFNEKLNSNTYTIKDPILDNKDKEKDGINNLINKLNEELKSNTTTQFYRKNSSSSRINLLNCDKRNRSNKNSYSKYYLSKLEMENKMMILQLSKRNDDFLNNKFFNINKI